MTGKSIEGGFLNMIGNNTKTVVNKKWAIAALAMGILCVALFIDGQYSFLPTFQNEEFARKQVFIELLALVVTPIIGFVVSIISLVKAFRKPTIYGGKIMAFIALVINTLFAIIVILVLFVMTGSLIFFNT